MEQALCFYLLRLSNTRRDRSKRGHTFTPVATDRHHPKTAHRQGDKPTEGKGAAKEKPPPTTSLRVQRQDTTPHYTTSYHNNTDFTPQHFEACPNKPNFALVKPRSARRTTEARPPQRGQSDCKDYNRPLATGYVPNDRSTGTHPTGAIYVC